MQLSFRRVPVGIGATLLVLASIVGVTPAAAQLEPLLDNGDFETGDFTSWVVSDLTNPAFGCQTDWHIDDAGVTGCTPDLSPPPLGNYAAYNSWDGVGPLEYTLEQSFVVPNGVSSANLIWYDTAVWNLVDWCGTGSWNPSQPPYLSVPPPAEAPTCAARQFHVDLLDDTGALIERVYTFEIEPGTEGVYDWTARQVPIGALLESYWNQTVTVRFTNVVPEPFTGPAGFGLDGVDITITDTSFLCRGLVPTIVGTHKDDHIIGTEGPDIIIGRKGQDLIEGRGGDDIICGNTGNDTILGGEGNDIVYGGPDDDLVDGEAGDDLLIGNTGNDTMDGGAGVDLVRGNRGDDILAGGDDDDTVLGGIGNDEGSGGPGDDVIRGNQDDDVLRGEDGNDLLRGKRGNDVIWGGPGDDGLRGNDGMDVLYGEEGNDSLRGNDAADELWGGDGDDRIRGGLGPDVIQAGAGFDFVRGGGGADVASGGDDADRMWGMGAADDLAGDAGDDWLHGGPDSDVLDGGDGTDTCVKGETLTSCEL